MSFANKTFVVTGGASGLGEATVRRLALLGANVGILDRDGERGEAIAKELGSRVAFFEMDATKEQSCKNAVQAAVTRFGNLWGAVNCAGGGGGKGPLLTVDKAFNVHDSDAWDITMKLNLYGTFNVCKYAAAAMAKNTPDENGLRGCLVNCASVAAFDGQKGQVAYASAKGAVTQMTLPMARDLGVYGIRVNTIAPGIMNTPMLARATDKVKAGLALGVVAPKRLGLADEFALLATQIIDNAYLNGEVIRLDGGLRMDYTSKL